MQVLLPVNSSLQEGDVDLAPRTRTTLIVAQECARDTGRCSAQWKLFYPPHTPSRIQRLEVSEGSTMNQPVVTRTPLAVEV